MKRCTVAPAGGSISETRNLPYEFVLRRNSEIYLTAIKEVRGDGCQRSIIGQDHVMDQHSECEEREMAKN